MTRFILFLCIGLFASNISLAKKPTPPKNSLFTISIQSLVHVSCSGGSNGAIFLTPPVGQGPFSFAWSNGATTQNISNLPAGQYSVTATDGNNEQAVLTNIEIDQPVPLVLTVSSIQHINCLNPHGALTVLATGGTPVYQYSWNTGQNTNSAVDLIAGNYTITTTDSHGCTTSVSATILADLAIPSANAGAPVNRLCSNTTSQLNGSGSAGPAFSYLWSAQNGGNIVSGATTLHPVINSNGDYSLTVTNTTNGCTATSSTSANSLHEAPVATTTGDTLTCTTPSRVLQASYSPVECLYGWQGPNGYTSSLLHPTVSVAGNYVFSVTDTLTGCSDQATASIIANTTPPIATASVSGTISCPTPTATLNATANPIGSLFYWTGPNGFSSNLQHPVVNLAGVYTVVVTSLQNGCTGSATATVSGNTTPPVVTASVSGILTCAVSGVYLIGSVTPAIGSTYSWSGPNGFTSNQLNPAVTTPGTYTLKATTTQNGCSATASVVVIRDNTPPNLSATGGVITCANPAITIHSSSGTPNVTFSWQGPGGFKSTEQNPVVSQTGVYIVTATNPVNGCINTVSVSVSTNLTIPVLLVNGSTITCAEPIGKPVASSPTPGTTFAWTGPGGFTFNGPKPQVTLPGFYTVTATNPANGCTVAASVAVNDDTTPPIAFISDPPKLNCTNTPILLSGFGSSSGSNITYLWTTYDGHILSGMFGLFPRVDAVGTYTIKVTNTQNGCTALDSVEVFQLAPVTVQINQIVPVSCYGTATGSATAKPGGGSGSYHYGWSNGATTATASGLTAGLYTVTVTDTEGCVAAESVLINQPTALQALVSVTHQTIYNQNNGTASVSSSGGTSPYSVKWSTGASTATIINLAPGTYTVTVTDNKGCTIVKTSNINAINCTLSGTVATTNISCSGAANGSATVNTTGGANPVNYLWSNGAQTKTISNLQPGNYKVTVTDATACSVTLNAQITSPDPLTLAFAVKENVPCPNSKSGLITAGVIGGTAPYTYAWSTGTTGASLTGLGPGTYTVTATDTRGCTKSLSAQITITDQTPPHLVLKNAAVALGASGTATVTASLFDNGSFDMECSIASLTVTPTSFDCNQLGMRTVTLTATDVNGNSSTGTAMVTVTDNIAPTLICPANITVGECTPIVQFAALQVTDNCTINPALIQLKSGLPSGSVFPIGKTLQVFSYTDAGGNTGECSFDVSVMQSPEASVTPSPSSCAGICDGSAIVHLGGADGPIEVHWSSGQSGLLAAGLCSTGYTVTVTDVYGCSQSLSVIIPSDNQVSFQVNPNSSAATCAAACDGAINLNITGGATPFEILWSDGQSGASANNLCAGTYTTTITDANGCSQTQDIPVDAVDQVVPVLLCPANITTAVCAPVATYTLPEVQDNCPVDPNQLQLQSGLPSGSSFPVGTTMQTFRYTDGGGNTGVCSFSVTVAGLPVVQVSPTDVTCSGLCTGSAALSASGGFGPFSFQWSNGQSGSTATNLCAGAYTATITDAAGCQQTAQTTIQAPAILTLIVDQKTDDTGNTGTGSILMSVSGGTGPYSFLWTYNGQAFATTQNLLGLYAGAYALVVTDANGCTTASDVIPISSVVAAHEATGISGLSLYPNPASSFVRLVLANPLGQDAAVHLISLSGTIVRSEQLSAGASALQLDVSDLPAGFWLVQVRAADGRETVKKLVLER